jgi:hypothetical protein
VGLARIFRETVRVADEQMERALQVITAPLRSRVKHHHKLRWEQIAQAERLYRIGVPTAFRIGAVEVTRDRAAFSIRERRICPVWMKNTAWDDDEYHEPGVALASYVMQLADGTFSERWPVQAIVSLHALSRHFERTGNRDHGVLVDDIAVLADASEDQDKVPTPTGYFWLGGMMAMRGPKQQGPVRAVRTLVIE